MEEAARAVVAIMVATGVAARAAAAREAAMAEEGMAAAATEAAMEGAARAAVAMVVTATMHRHNHRFGRFLGRPQKSRRRTDVRRRYIFWLWDAVWAKVLAAH